MTNKLFTSPLPVKEELKRLPLNLQFFADNPDNPDNPDQPDEPDFDVNEVLEKPEVKEAVEKRFKEQLGKRLSNKDKEIERLKAELEGKAQPDDKGDKERRKPEDSEAVQKIKSEADRRIKVSEMKVFAANEGIDSFLFRKFVNVDDIELDEDGEATNLNEVLEWLRDDARTAKYFAVTNNEDAPDDEPTNKQYRPGGKQKTNEQKKVNLYELGKKAALERQKKKEDKS